MPTGTQIINRALSTLNIQDDGGSVSASELSALLIELNNMISAWGTDNTLVPTVKQVQVNLTANTNGYYYGTLPVGFTGTLLLPTGTSITATTAANPTSLTITAHGFADGQTVKISGYTGNWTPLNAIFPVTVTGTNTFTVAVDSSGFGAVTGTPIAQTTQRPVRIEDVYQVATVGSGSNRNKLEIVSAKRYFDHNDLNAAGTTADEVYFDYADNNGLMQVYTYPVCTCPTATSLSFIQWSPIVAFTLSGDQSLPDGYQDAIVYGLAFRCIPRYGAVIDTRAAQIVTDTGKQAKDRIRLLNVQNRLLDPSTIIPPAEAAQKAAQ